MHVYHRHLVDVDIATTVVPKKWQQQAVDVKHSSPTKKKIWIFFIISKLVIIVDVLEQLF